jgi:exosortase family protein XrtG
MGKLPHKIAIFLAALIVTIYFLPSGMLFVQDIQIDGQLQEWRGRASLSESTGKGANPFASLHWATNANERKIYFAVKLQNPAAPGDHLLCRLFLDIDDNGSYTDRIDKYAEISCVPGFAGGTVEVKLYSSSGNLINEYEGMWGQESDSGRGGFEFYLPMSDLHIYPAQPIRFYLAGLSAGRLPVDGDVQWKVFPVVTRDRSGIAIFAVCWLLATAALYHYRIWPLYYVLGAVGFTIIVILAVRGTLLEYTIEYWIGMVLHHILNEFGILTYVFDKSPGTILVFIKTDNSWTTLNIDIESSALFEIAVLLGLVLFYPAYGARRKLYYILVGTATLGFFNLVRLLLITTLIYWGGRSFNFVAHTLFGRVFFFAVIVALYWHILTRPSINKVLGDVKRA